ncbi:MAG: DbpA RNA binding domain-containing protein [Treponema sp.]|nr:DbpA RNA binding domain-containing protein [Treponema sp.]
MGYNNYNRDFEINESKTADLLKNAVTKITTEEDIDTLTKLIKLYKANVPLSRRKYVAAYLLKEALKHYHFTEKRDNKNNSHSKNRNNESRDNRENRDSRDNRNEYKQNHSEKNAAQNRGSALNNSASAISSTEEVTERPRHPRVEIDPDKATSIFVSIGKNRRVYPRDLVGLLVAVGGIDRERIGDIKVLANYSFVQLYTEDCQNAIDKLNGMDYRGRKLVVSFSRQKTEDDDLDEKAADYKAEEFVPEVGNVAEPTITPEQMSAEDAAAYAAAEKAAADKEPFGV